MIISIAIFNTPFLPIILSKISKKVNIPIAKI
nr:MAG TPA: hypothetical protein [Caudoviricetes sp.]